MATKVTAGLAESSGRFMSVVGVVDFLYTGIICSPNPVSRIE